MSEKIATWRGRPASELTREELIQAYSSVVRMLQDERDFHRRAYELERELEDTQRLIRLRSMRGL